MPKNNIPTEILKRRKILRLMQIAGFGVNLIQFQSCFAIKFSFQNKLLCENSNFRALLWGALRN